MPMENQQLGMYFPFPESTHYANAIVTVGTIKPVRLFLTVLVSTLVF